MARTHYLDAAGVVRIRWQRGDPPMSASVVLVEVWRSVLYAGEFTQAHRPEVAVVATVEVWVRTGDKWGRVSHGGQLDVVTRLPNVDVRRWAPLPDRRWTGVVALDGWQRETED